MAGSASEGSLIKIGKADRMQGSRCPEEWGVHGCTPQRRRKRETPQMAVFHQQVKTQSNDPY